MTQSEAAMKLRDCINEVLDEEGVNPVEVVGLLDLFKASINEALMQIVSEGGEYFATSARTYDA
jgi:hypothetical protein